MTYFVKLYRCFKRQNNSSNIPFVWTYYFIHLTIIVSTQQKPGATRAFVFSGLKLDPLFTKRLLLL